jgi:hypothetical protein
MTFPVTVDLPPGCGVLTAGEDDREERSSGMGDTPLFLDACTAPSDEEEAGAAGEEAVGAPGAMGLVGALTLMEGCLGGALGGSAAVLGGIGAPRFVSLRTCDALEAGSIWTTVSGAALWLRQNHILIKNSLSKSLYFKI